MKIKKLFTASFENSLNLLDIPSVYYQENEFKDKSKTISKLRKIIYFIIVVLFFYGFHKLCTFRHGYYHDYIFIPFWLFVISLLILIFAILFSFFKKYGMLRLYVERNTTITVIIILNIYLILFVLQIFLNRIPLFCLIIGFMIIFLVSYIMFKQQILYLYSILYDVKEEKNKKINYFINKVIMKFMFIILVTLLIVKYFLKFLGFDVLNFLNSELLKSLYLFLTLSGCIVVSIAIFVYLLLPFSLFGYYKYKYSEEYRDFEGVSKEEWYGKKYKKLNK